MRIAIASMLQETNTFSPLQTKRSDFLLTPGHALIAAHRTEESELHGFIDVLEQAGTQIVPIVGGWAVTSGPIGSDDLHSLTAEITDGIKEIAPVDGVLLALHGAWAGRELDSCDGYVLQEVRRAIGPAVPIVATFDLHGNVAHSWYENADVLVALNTCPHIDHYDTGVRAGKILLLLLRGEIRPTMAGVKIPMVVQADNMVSYQGVFGQIINYAKSLERQPGVISTSVFACQPWLDVDELGWTAVVITDHDEARAKVLANDLARFIWPLRQVFVIPLPSVNEALDQALKVDGGPVVLAEGADGTMGGAPGDGTSILAGILREKIDVPVAATVVDPVAVQEAVRAGVGNVVTLDVGGKLDPRFAQPVRITGKVKLISDGEWQHKGRGFTGRLIKMGKCAVVSSGNILLLISERAGPTFDPEMYRSHGIEPKDMKLVLVKSPLQTRLEYALIYRAFISVNSPGCCSPDLTSLPYKRIPRPMFPFDEFDFSPPP